MRVLVTGATGFIGSHLLERLTQIGGHDLCAMQRHATGDDLVNAEGSAKIVSCDLCDRAAVRKAVRELQPEAVFHLASISPVSYSYDHPNAVLEANLTGTVNLAEACLREAPRFEHFLFASTSEVFGNGPLPKREDTPQAPNSPYSVSKHAAEKYLQYMWQAYRFPTTILRPFNTYGRRDNANYLVERMLVQMLSGDTVKLGDPTPERDLLYIQDHVDAYMKCFANPQASIGDVFVFGTGEKISVRALADRMRAVTGFRGEILWNTIPRRPLDIQSVYCDASKAKSILGWEARVSLDEGLRRTADFWRKKLAVSNGAIPASAT